MACGTPNFREHLLGICIMVLVGTLWSFSGLMTRLLSQEVLVHPLEMVGFRSSFAALPIFLFVLLTQKRNLLSEFIKSAPTGYLHAAFWTIIQTCFLAALAYTSSAHVFLIAGLSPIFAAVFSRLVLKTKLPSYTYAALAAAWAGVLWMGTNGAGTEGGIPGAKDLFGIFLVLTSTFCAGANFVLMQGWGRSKNLMPAAVIGTFSAGFFGIYLIWRRDPRLAAGRCDPFCHGGAAYRHPMRSRHQSGPLSQRDRKQPYWQNRNRSGTYLAMDICP